MDPGLWKKAVMDSNVAAQQEGITALCAFLEYGGHNACLRYDPSCVVLEILI
jgi:protein STU2